MIVLCCIRCLICYTPGTRKRWPVPILSGQFERIALLVQDAAGHCRRLDHPGPARQGRDMRLRVESEGQGVLNSDCPINFPQSDKEVRFQIWTSNADKLMEDSLRSWLRAISAPIPKMSFQANK